MKNSNIYAGYPYPAQIISYDVWFYQRFILSFGGGDIEELFAVKCIIASYETSGSVVKTRCYLLQPDQKESVANFVILGIWMRFSSK